jgi:glycosyltransferase involved in cell wall biosynthesis
MPRERIVTPERETGVTARCHRTVAGDADDGCMTPSPHAAPIVVDTLPVRRRSLRIAVVTETYPPEVNGVAMSIARVVEGLQRRHHELLLVRPRQPDQAGTRPGPALEEFLTGGWPIPRYPDLRMGAPSKRALLQLWALRRPDVVHVATEGPLGWSALQAARRLRLPVTSDFRTNFHAYGQHYRIGWLARPIMAYLRKFHNRTQRTMVPTDALRARLQAQGFDRLSVVSRGVDTRLFHPRRRSQELRRSWGAGEHTTVLAYVGRLAPEKNLGVMVRTFEALRDARVDVKLLFVGAGPLRAELQARCPCAVFAGSRSGEDLAAHYASADVFLFPSLTETFGNVTLEAMASGLPVIAYNSAAAGQLIVRGRNGMLADGEDEAAFVRAGLALAGDRARFDALGSAARATVQSFDWDEIVSRFENVLVAAMDEHERAVPGRTDALQRLPV